MQLIIRYIEAKGIGRQISQSSFSGARVSVGRGTDQVIQIADKRLPLSHSYFSRAGSGQGLSLTGVAGQRFVFNGQRTKHAELNVGDSVVLFGHELTVLAGEDGTDFVIEAKIEAETVEKLRDRYTTRLSQVGVPERKLAWAFFLVIICVGLLIPAAGFFVGMDTLRDSPLPDDDVWLTGPIHQTHAFIGDDCTACHVEAFTQTRDQECLSCHQNTNHHFDTEVFGTSYRGGDSCADCHKEHSVTDSITRTDQDSCSVCHADLQTAGFDTDRLEPASDFLQDHPGFRVTLQRMQADNSWTSERVNLWDDDLEEVSNLIFPHDVHLDAEGINGPGGKSVMACTDCHQPEKGGLRMQGVTMEKHCSDCHELTFDPSSPDRVVPHGSPEDLMRTLREYYAYEFILQQDGTSAAAKRRKKAKLELPQARDVRRPGRSKRTKSISDIIVELSIDQDAPKSQQATAFIEAKVADAAENLFEKQTCTICHEIIKETNPSLAAEVPWQVKPVRLNAAWMPLSVFSHDGHKNMQCEGCHEAESSTLATDVLMPDLGSCRTCHGGEHAEGLLQSTCISCHDFHLDSQKPMGHREAKSTSVSMEKKQTLGFSKGEHINGKIINGREG